MHRDAPAHNECTHKADDSGFDTRQVLAAVGGEPLLVSTEAADYLRVSRKTLQKLSKSDEIPAIRIGRLWRYRRSDLDGWISARVRCASHPCREKGKD